MYKKLEVRVKLVTDNIDHEFSHFSLAGSCSLRYISLFLALFITAFESDLENIMRAMYIKGNIAPFTDNPHSTYSVRSNL